MVQARIEINAVPGSDDDLPINTLVQLSNDDTGGEVTYAWAILDQPPGATDSLSSAVIENPTFTPKKEGTYLIELIVNLALPTEKRDTVIAAIRQVKTRERIPAAGETTEADASDGWATAMNQLLRRMDLLLSDPGVVVGVNATGSSMAKGTVVRVTGGTTIKSGLPGQETVPSFTVCLATSLGQVDELLCVIEGDVNGVPSVGAGQIARARYLGSIKGLTSVGGAVGDSVYVTDTGTISITAGTIKRHVGSIMGVSGANRDVWFDGVGGFDITPIDAPYVIYGPAGLLTNAHRIDGNNAQGAVGAIPHVFRAGDVNTLALAVRAFAGSVTYLQEWQASGGGPVAWMSDTGDLRLGTDAGLECPGTGFQITLEGGLLLDTAGYILFANGAKTLNQVAMGEFATSVPLTIKRFSAGATVNLQNWTTELGSLLLRVTSAGNIDMNGQQIWRALCQAPDNGAVPLIAKQFGASGLDIFKVQTSGGADLLTIRSDGTVDLEAGHVILSLRNDTSLSSASNRGLVLGRRARNQLGNSGFDFTGPIGSAASILTGARTLKFERWSAWRNSVGAPTFQVQQTSIAAVSPVRPAPFCNRITFAVNPSPGFDPCYLTQEVDRTLVRSLAGKTVQFTATLRVGAGFTGNVFLQITTGTNAAEVAGLVGNYATGSVVAALAAVSPSTSFAPATTFSASPIADNVRAMAVILIVVPTSVGSGTNYIDITEAMLVESDAFSTTADVVAWERMGASLAEEETICQEFWEKTYVAGVAPGTVTFFASIVENYLNLTANAGVALPMSMPRFVTAKRATPIVTVYAASTGAAGSIDISGPGVQAVTISITSRSGFELLNNTGAPITGASITSPYQARFHFTADAEL